MVRIFQLFQSCRCFRSFCFAPVHFVVCGNDHQLQFLSNLVPSETLDSGDVAVLGDTRTLDIQSVRLAVVECAANWIIVAGDCGELSQLFASIFFI